MPVLRLAVSPLLRRTSSPPDHVIVFGRYAPAWDASVDATAPVWRGMPGVGRVTRAKTLLALLRLGRFGGRKAIVVPLRERFMAWCPPLWWRVTPNRRAFETCRDKGRFAAFAAAHGLADVVPQTYASAADAVYPLVLKRTNKAGGLGIAIVHSPDELQQRLRRRPWRGRPVLLQSLVPGQSETATHGVVRHGRFIWHCSYRYELDPADPVQRKQTVLARHRETASAEDIATLERFLVPLDYSGAVQFDYRHLSDGRLVVFEINPRFGGSLMRPENSEDMRAGLAALLATARPPFWQRPRQT